MATLAVLAAGALAVVQGGASRAEGPQRPVGQLAITYKEVGSQALQLHVWTPPGWNSAQHRPVMVFFHGGGWLHGSYADFARQAAYFASRGLVTLSVDYRVEGPVSATRDGIDAYDYVTHHASDLGVDLNRIVVAGGSAGGQIALSTLRTDLPGSEAGAGPAAVVLYNPVTDTTGGYPVGYGRRLFAGDAEAADYSPYQHIRPGAPPTLIMQGTADTTVSIQNSVQFVRTMREDGNDAALVTYEGQAHGFFNRDRYLVETVRQTDLYLQSLGLLDGPQYIRSGPPQLVRNGSFTSGLDGWESAVGTTASVALDPEASLPKSAHLTGDGAPVGLGQDITAGLRRGGPGEYTLGARVLQADGGDAVVGVRIMLKDSTSGSWRSYDLPSESVTGNRFSLVSGTRVLDWSGELESARLEVTVSGVAGTYVDDVGTEFLGAP